MGQRTRSSAAKVADSKIQGTLNWNRGTKLKLLRNLTGLKHRQMLVLRALDDAIGEHPDYRVRLRRIMDFTQMSRSTVLRGIRELIDARLIERTRVWMDRRECAGQFRVFWFNVHDFDKQHEPDTQSETTELCRPADDEKLTAPGGMTSPAVRVTPPSGQDSASENAPARDGKGRSGNSYWTDVTDGQLRAAVKLRKPELIQRLWEEADSRWSVTFADGDRIRFFTATVYVAMAPGDEVERPVSLLRWKLNNRNWRTGRNDQQDETQAAELLRIVDGAPMARTSNLFRSGSIFARIRAL